MARRREFLQAGLAVSVLPLAGPILGRSADTRGSEVPAVGNPRTRATAPIHKVIFDECLPESRGFAQEAARLGLSAVPFADGDITHLWYNELDLAWSERPLAIAGLTYFGPLFVLERLACDRGMRVLFRAEHRRSSANGLEHILSGPLPMLDASTALADVGPDFAPLMANLIARCTPDCNGSATRRIVSPRQQPAAEDPVYSWLIGPREHA